jgi:hypothetical protein
MIDIDKKYQTRDGHAVRLISNNGTPEYPIIGVVDGIRRPMTWTPEGGYLDSAKSPCNLDLMPVPLTKMRVAVWVDENGDPRCAPTRVLRSSTDKITIVEVPR